MGLRRVLGLKPPRKAPPITIADDIDEARVDGCQVLSNRIELLRRIPSGGVGAEIGVAFGDFSDAILHINRPQKLYLIDTWHTDRYRPGRQHVTSRFANEIEAGEVVILEGYSTDVLPKLPVSSLDWVYIDTTHQFDTTLAELSLSAQLIKEGGYIAGHDFCTKKTYGVIPAVFKFCTEHNWQFKYVTIDGNGAFSFCLKRATQDISGIRDVTINGILMRCHTSDNHTERYIAIHGVKDTENITRITSFLAAGDTFVDVGANCGLYALHAARQVGPHGRVIAIDADEEILRRLSFNAQANNFENIEVVHSAVGDESGSVLFHVHQSNRGQSSVAEQSDTIGAHVPIAPLAKLLSDAQVSAIKALKIDVEGHEDRVLVPFLHGSARSLWPSKILLEVKHANRWRRPCLTLLEQEGYRQTWKSRNDVLLEL